MFSAFDEIAYRHLFTTLFDGDQACWKKNILCEEDYLEKVDKLLTGAPAPTHKKIFQNFLSSPLIEYICGKDESYQYWYLNGYECIRRKYNREACVYVGLDRVKKNNILIGLHNKERTELGERIELDKKAFIKLSPSSSPIRDYLWEKEIVFNIGKTFLSGRMTIGSPVPHRSETMRNSPLNGNRKASKRCCVNWTDV